MKRTVRAWLVVGVGLVLTACSSGKGGGETVPTTGATGPAPSSVVLTSNGAQSAPTTSTTLAGSVVTF